MTPAVTLPTIPCAPNYICNAWIISDFAPDASALISLVKSHGINCTRVLSCAEVSTQITNVLSDHARDTPDFIWVTLPKMLFKNPAVARCHVAVRLVLHQQLLSGKQICVEGATTSPSSQNPNSTAFYLDPSWFDRFPLFQSKVWWCSLGLQTGSNKANRNCLSTCTVSSMSLPQRYLSCCTPYGKHRGKLPRSTPQSHYIAVVKMLRESIVSLNPSLSYESEPLSAVPVDSTAHFPASTTVDKASTPAGAVPKKRSKAVGAKTLSAEDGPGEHVDVVVVRDRKWLEDCFDDCGDDLSAIKGSDDKEMFTVFDDVVSTAYASDSEESSDIDDLFDNCFLNHAFPSSDCANAENPYESEAPNRPFSTHFDSSSSMLAFLSQHEGAHDVCELFGGKGLCTQIAIRRQLRTGPNWDIVCDLDLEKPEQIAALWQYIETHKPRVIIAGPPCTAFGPWSRLNKTKNPEAYARALKVGMLLASLVAEICEYQLQQHRHFLIENPWGSALWLYQHLSVYLPCPTFLWQNSLNAWSA